MPQSLTMRKTSVIAPPRYTWRFSVSKEKAGTCQPPETTAKWAWRQGSGGAPVEGFKLVAAANLVYIPEAGPSLYGKAGLQGGSATQLWPVGNKSATLVLTAGSV